MRLLLPLLFASSLFGSTAIERSLGTLGGYGFVVEDNLGLALLPLLGQRDNFCGLHCMTIAPCCPQRAKNTLWAHGIGDAVHQNSRGTIPHFHSMTGGALIGYDKVLSEAALFSLGTGYTHSFVHYRKNKGTGNVDSAQLGGVGCFCIEPVSIDTALLGGYHWISSTRGLPPPSSAPWPHASFHAGSLLAHLGAAIYLRTRGLEWAPFGRVDYNWICEEGFTETNGLHIRARTPTFLKSEAGFRFGYPTCVIFGTFVPRFKVSWVRLQPLTGTKIETDAFTVPTTHYTFDGVSPGASLSFVIRDYLDITAGYESEYMDGRNVQRLDLALACQF